MLFYSIKLTFSSLSPSSGRAPSCCLFHSLTNFIDFGQGWIVQLIILSGIGLQDLLVIWRIYSLPLETFFIFPPLTGDVDLCVRPLVESTPLIREKKTPLIRVNNFSECFTGQLKIKPRINLQSFFIENKNDSRF